MSGTNDFDFSRVDDYLALSREHQQIVRMHIIQRAKTERAKAIRAALWRLLKWPWQVATAVSDATGDLAIRFGAALIRWWRAQAERRARLKGVAQLEALSDRELWDIGLRRCEIHSVVHHGRYERPTRALGKGAASLSGPPSGRSGATAGSVADVNERKRAA